MGARTADGRTDGRTDRLTDARTHAQAVKDLVEWLVRLLVDQPSLSWRYQLMAAVCLRLCVQSGGAPLPTSAVQWLMGSLTAENAQIRQV